MIRAGSTPLGQRAVQVSQVRQSQIESASKSLSRESTWANRSIWCGLRLISSAIGQPAVHLPHW